jgi:transcriptional regulator with XRE-family HTH domain
MANTDDRTLGELLRDSRVAADMTLRGLATELDIAPSYLSDIENDRRVPSAEVLQALSKLLRLDFDDLMARAGRVGDEAERYLRQHPSVGLLFRTISDRRLSDEEVKRLLQHAKRMPGRKGKP